MEQVVILAIIITLILIYLVFLLSKKIGSIFEKQITWIFQNTVFSNYTIFKYSVYLFFILIFIFSINLYFTEKFIGIFYLGTLMLIIGRIIYLKMNNRINLRQDFEYQKHSTSISFYKSQNEVYRRKCYQVMVEKIKRINLKNQNIADGNFLNSSFFQKLELIIPFEYFDYKLETSKSDLYIGRLFYYNFEKSMKNIVVRILNYDNTQGNDLISKILASRSFLKFNDTQGLFYDEILIDAKFESKKNDISVNKIIEKIEDLKFMTENIFENIIPNNFETLLKELLIEIKNIATNERIVKYQLTDNATQSMIISDLYDQFQRRHKIELNSNQKADIKEFVHRNFKNFRNKQGVTKGSYEDKNFFIENREIFLSVVQTICDNRKLDKSKVSKIIYQEFSEFYLESKTIQDRL